MADPVSAALIVSAVVGAGAAIQQGNAAKAAANYNADISLQNAAIAKADSDAQALQIDRENYMRLGAIRTAQGKAGGSASEGSVLDVLGDVAAQGELDKQYALYEGEQRARGFTNTATLDRFSGKQAQTSGYLKAGTELLGGAASASYYSSRMKRT